MFSQGIDLNESYDGSSAMRRGAFGPGVDIQASGCKLVDETTSDVFNGSQVWSGFDMGGCLLQHVRRNVHCMIGVLCLCRCTPTP